MADAEAEAGRDLLGEQEVAATLNDAAVGVSAVMLVERTAVSATIELTTIEGAQLRVALTRTGADVVGAARADGTSAFDSLHTLLMAHSKAYGGRFLAAAAQRALAARAADEDDEHHDDDAASR